MAHDPKAVANFFLDCAKEDGETLTPMKLVKMVYLAHGWTLGLTSEPLIKENAEAWKYGPVIPSLYHDFKEFGNHSIDRYARWPEWQGDEVVLQSPKLQHDSAPISILKKVWNVYKRYTARQLSDMTHREGTPWHKTWYQLGGNERLGTDIPDDLIKKHYAKLVKEAAQDG